MIEYRQGDLFSVTDPNAILTHACNCQGAWGSGVARCFRDSFPEAFKYYANICRNARGIQYGTRVLVGQADVWENPKGPDVGILFTSDDYGPRVDNPAMIIAATLIAFPKLLLCCGPEDVIHMPKINSGLFRVEWERTEAVLEACLSESNPNGTKVVVWSLP